MRIFLSAERLYDSINDFSLEFFFYELYRVLSIHWYHTRSLCSEHGLIGFDDTVLSLSDKCFFIIACHLFPLC